jgi:hypothetical protein
MASLEKYDPDIPHHPELLVATSHLPFRSRIVHSICQLTVHPNEDPDGVNIEIQHPDHENRNKSFSVSVQKPTAATGIFFPVNPDFESCLPGGVVRRPDRPEKRMLTESGLAHILQVLAEGYIEGFRDYQLPLF